MKETKTLTVSDSPVHTLLPRPDLKMTQAPSTGIADNVNKDQRKINLPLMWVHGAGHELDNPVGTLVTLTMWGDCSQPD